MDDIGLIGILYFVESENSGGMEELIKRRLDYLGNTQRKFFIQLYSSNLIALQYGNNIYNSDDLYIGLQENIFFKAIYLKKQFILFTYISDPILLFETYKFNYNFGFNNIYSNFDNSNPIYIDTLYFLNDFIKINDRRIIFIYTNKINTAIIRDSRITKRNLEFPNFLLNIIIIDIDQSYNLNINIHKTISYWEDYLPIMQISGCLYNDFLLLSTTYENINDYLNGNDNYFSIFMIFGYPNGTDGTIDISYFLNDINNNQDNEK